MTIANGSLTDADEVLAMGNIRQVYTGTGFNSNSSSATPDTQDHELTAIGAVPNSNYAVVKMTGTSIVNAQGLGGNQIVELKAQIKETGQAYGDIMGYKTVLRNGALSIDTMSSTYQLVATLTAGQKTNGFQIKVFSQSTGAASSRSASWTNVQTVVEVRT